MRQLVISILVPVSLVTTACASMKKAEAPPSVQAPAVIAEPAAAGAGVPAVSQDGVSIVTCEKGKDHRTLDLRTKDAGCEAVYTKGGQAAVVAKAKHGVDRCEAALKKSNRSWSPAATPASRLAG